jgi:hypothetical protein
MVDLIGSQIGKSDVARVHPSAHRQQARQPMNRISADVQGEDSARKYGALSLLGMLISREESSTRSNLYHARIASGNPKFSPFAKSWSS